MDRLHRIGMFMYTDHDDQSPNYVYMTIKNVLEGWAETLPEQLVVGFYRISFPSTKLDCDSLFHAVRMLDEIYKVVPRGTQVIIVENTDDKDGGRTYVRLFDNTVLGIQPAILMGFYRAVIPLDPDEHRDLLDQVSNEVKPESVNDPGEWWGPAP